jgi:hypothetical protein
MVTNKKAGVHYSWTFSEKTFFLFTILPYMSYVDLHVWPATEFICKQHFQQYFSYIVAVSFIGGGTRRKPLTCRKSLTNLCWPTCMTSNGIHLQATEFIWVFSIDIKLKLFQVSVEKIFKSIIVKICLIYIDALCRLLPKLCKLSWFWPKKTLMENLISSVTLEQIYFNLW